MDGWMMTMMMDCDCDGDGPRLLRTRLRERGRHPRPSAGEGAWILAWRGAEHSCNGFCILTLVFLKAVFCMWLFIHQIGCKLEHSLSFRLPLPLPEHKVDARLGALSVSVCRRRKWETDHGPRSRGEGRGARDEPVCWCWCCCSCC